MAAAPRAYWKGQLRLSLVSIGVTLFSATESGHHPTLRQIHQPSGQRVRYEKTAAGVGPVDTADIVKGYEIDDDTYVVLEPEELDEIKLESRRAIELVQFVDQHEIDPRYFDRPYYLVPDGEVATEGFSVIRDALRGAKKTGLGQMVMRGREYLVAVRPCGKGLLLETLRYADEVRSSDSVFDDLPDLELDKELLDLAHELIERKAKPFHAAAFKDSYAEALHALVERKRKGRKIVHTGDDAKERRTGEVVDLMEALKKSVSSSGDAKKKASRSSGAKSESGGRRRKAG